MFDRKSYMKKYLKEYRKKKYDSLKSYVICQICKRKFKQIQWRHLKTHGISTKEYISLFPETKLISEDSYKRKYSKERNLKVSKSSKGKIISKKQREKISKTLTGRNLPIEVRQKQSISLKNHWQNNPKKRKSYSKRMKKLVRDPTYIKKVSSGVRKAQSKPSYKFRNGITIWYDSTYAGKVCLQSSWELKIAKLLDSHQIKWIRPSKSNRHTFSWIDSNGKRHTYYPDFYIPKYDIYLEPKMKLKAEGRDKEKLSFVKEHYPISLYVLTEEKKLNWNFISSLLNQ